MGWWRKKSAGAASLRGQGTPALSRPPPQCASKELVEKLSRRKSKKLGKNLSCRNSKEPPNMLAAARADSRSGTFVGAGPCKRCKFGPRIFRRNRSGGCKPGSDGFPSRNSFTFLPRREGIHSAQWRQPRRQRLLRGARCAVRGRGSGHVRVRPK